ncbi:sphingomyelin phosphodiesterase [Hesseltinella vesiculosa]|uniref:Sphingomyelin phosphodiesterase n=1 Tax=Hesseltinella vesiculosa TaxID=101127 RepID=A0A1X2GQY6_9FUNG|nr:sphingomyelin phosphodiesterase [Hesseltinella vesiculosa]
MPQLPFQHDTLATTSENALLHVTEQWLDADSVQQSCSSCISALQLIKSLSYTSEKLLIRALINVCKRTKRVSADVCKGMMEEQVPIARKVIKTMDISGRDGHLLCAAVAGSCPYPEVEPFNITFPKPKPDDYPIPEPSGDLLTILHLSDWHVDPEYETNADAVCDKPFCCRSSFTDYNNVTKPASMWGEYTCDTPLALVESMLEYIEEELPDVDFGLMTGDIPPHEVWNTLPFLKTQLIHEGAYALLHAHFDSEELVNTRLYPAIGNHEAAPTNNFPLSGSNYDENHEYLSLQWMYDTLMSRWRSWTALGDHAYVETKTGSYAAYPVPGLKLISLNTNFCYTLNWWLYQRPGELDPDGMLSWLVRQLQDAEDRKERVWIVGHISPGDSTCFHDYSNYYHQIVERYAPHVIVAQFFGHTHKDEFQLFYRSDQQAAETAISVGYIGPSITPFLNVNPGFRVYKVDSRTFEVVDAITYIADLDRATSWLDTPNWHVEYSARDAYHSPKANLPHGQSPLLASWWHKVTEEMESNNATFEKYWRYRSKSSPIVRPCDESCMEETICNIRAGKAEHRCDFEPDRLPIDPSACGLGLHQIDQLSQ